MKTYTTTRLQGDVLQGLRSLERSEKRKASYSGSVDYLLRFHKLIKKLDKELYEKIKFTLS